MNEEVKTGGKSTSFSVIPTGNRFQHSSLFLGIHILLSEEVFGPSKPIHQSFSNHLDLKGDIG